MKRWYLVGACLSLSLAAQQAPLEKLMTPPELNVQRVEQHVEKLKARQARADKAEYVLIGAGVASLVYPLCAYVYYKYNPTNPDTMSEQAKNELIATWHAQLPAASTQGWLKWAWSKSWSGLQYFGKSFVGWYAMNQATQIVFNKMPRITNWLLFEPSAQWGLEQNTRLEPHMVSVTGWFMKNLACQDALDLSGLMVCAHDYSREMEKLIAYFVFVEGELEQQEGVAKDVARYCIQSCNAQLIALQQEIAQFITKPQHTERDIQDLCGSWLESFYETVVLCQHFDFPASQLGFFSNPRYFESRKRQFLPQLAQVPQIKAPSMKEIFLANLEENAEDHHDEAHHDGVVLNGVALKKHLTK